MNGSSEAESAEFYARTYDASLPEWPGEMAFYRELAAEATRHDSAVLEVACGTGRIAIPLAQEGHGVVGLDASPWMLAVAQQKSHGLKNLRWIQADMRSFHLGETFARVVIPGHSFQHLTTAEDQVACLRCLKTHLRPGGLLVIHVDHQDLAWLGSLPGESDHRFEAVGQFQHQKTGGQVRTSKAWAYDRATQTASAYTRWEELDAGGLLLRTLERGPVHLHCLFRFELEHLLPRCGFEVEAVYGDFSCTPLAAGSREMIWMARNPAPGA